MKTTILAALCAAGLFAQNDYANTNNNTQTKPYVDHLASGDGCDDQWQFFAYGDFFYWEEYADDFSNVTITDNAALNNNVASTTTQKSNPTVWDVGFTVGIGAVMGEDAWKVNAEWTSFHPRNIDSLYTGNSFIINIVRHKATALVAAETINKSSTFKYDEANLLFSRSFKVAPSVCVDPSFGLSSMWVDQKKTHTLSDIVTDSLERFSTSDTHTCDFWGIGPSFGSAVNWNLIGCFGLIGKISGSLYWGRFHKEHLSSDTFVDTSLDNVINSDKFDTQFAVRPAATAEFGLQYEQCSCSGVYMLAKVSYVSNYLWNQFPLPNDSQDGLNRDISTHGFNLRLSVGY